jgi:transposase
MSNVRFIGLDVHAETIAVAVAEPDGEVRSLGVIPNRLESIQKLVKKLGPPTQLRVCYEAGPTGYVVYWQLTALDVPCEVVAPTLVPVNPGDRVKTDRRDALKLARSYRAGDLTAVWVPDAPHEALRDVVRAREAAKFEVPIVGCQPRIDNLHDGNAAVSENQCAWGLLAAMARVALDANGEKPLVIHPVTIRP